MSEGFSKANDSRKKERKFGTSTFEPKTDKKPVPGKNIHGAVHIDIPNSERNHLERDATETQQPLIGDQASTDQLDFIHSKTSFETTSSFADRKNICVKWPLINSFLAVLALLGVILLVFKMKQTVIYSDPKHLPSSYKGDPYESDNSRSNVFGMFSLDQTSLADHGRLVWKKKTGFNYTTGVEAIDTEPCVTVSFDGYYKCESQITFKFSADKGVFSAAHAISTKTAPAFKEDILVKSPIQTSPNLFTGPHDRHLHTSYLSVLARLHAGDMICIQTSPNTSIYVSPIDNMLDVIKILPL